MSVLHRPFEPHCKAVEPDDPSTFHRLIHGAVAITIATELDLVDDL